MNGLQLATAPINYLQANRTLIEIKMHLFVHQNTEKAFYN